MQQRAPARAGRATDGSGGKLAHRQRLPPRRRGMAPLVARTCLSTAAPRGRFLQGPPASPGRPSVGVRGSGVARVRACACVCAPPPRPPPWLRNLDAPRASWRKPRPAHAGALVRSSRWAVLCGGLPRAFSAPLRRPCGAAAHVRGARLRVRPERPPQDRDGRYVAAGSRVPHPSLPSPSSRVRPGLLCVAPSGADGPRRPSSGVRSVWVRGLRTPTHGEAPREGALPK